MENHKKELYQYMELLEYNIIAFGNYNFIKRKEIIKKLKKLTILSIKSGLDIDKILKEIGIFKKEEEKEKDLKKENEKENNEIDDICNSLYKNDLKDKIYAFLQHNKSKIFENEKNQNQEEQKTINKQFLSKKRSKKI
jgi:hypothetical protein